MRTVGLRLRTMGLRLRTIGLGLAGNTTGREAFDGLGDVALERTHMSDKVLHLALISTDAVDGAPDVFHFGLLLTDGRDDVFQLVNAASGIVMSATSEEWAGGEINIAVVVAEVSFDHDEALVGLLQDDNGILHGPG